MVQAPMKFVLTGSKYHEEGFSYADPSMLEIMDVQMVSGQISNALKGQSPLGRVMYLNGNNEEPFTINAVMEDFPSNSHLSYDFLITLSSVEFGEGEQTRWMQNNYFTYIVMKPGKDMAAFDKKIMSTLLHNYLMPASEAAGYVMPENIESKVSMKSQALTDINLKSSQIDFETSFRNDIKIIWIFGIVALFILIIASINFVNLSTAKSANRAKEVGLRKVVGSNRANLIAQFLTESVLITIIAFGVGILLSVLLLPYFQDMSGIVLEIPWTHLYFVPSILSVAILVGVLAGLYPSFYLSGFDPINVLKGKLRMGSKSGGLRSTLVVFQFTISIILIVGTLVVNQQMNHILESKIGFEKEQVIQLYGTNMLEEQVSTFKEEIKSLTGVSSLTISDFLPIVRKQKKWQLFCK
ncbi:MAG: putative ABC transport system permease protein [Arcticibacterium sp.]|jgi:putative ABC transport system permease protein